MNQNKTAPYNIAIFFKTVNKIKCLNKKKEKEYTACNLTKSYSIVVNTIVSLIFISCSVFCVHPFYGCRRGELQVNVSTSPMTMSQTICLLTSS